MKTWPGRVALLCSIVVLLGSAAPLPVGAVAAAPHLMPPHPRLLEEYEAGRMPVPDFVTNPDLLRAKGIDSPAEPVPLLGSLKALAVVVDFSDKVGTVTASYFDTMVFALPVAGRGSVYDYFDEVSYGQIDIVTVNLPSSMGWKLAPQTYAYYVNSNYCIYGTYPNNCQKLAEDIVDAVNSVVDFSDYDNDGNGYAEPIMIIHAGRGAEYTGSTSDIWSHSWELYSAKNYDGVTIADYVIMPEYWSTVSAGTSDMTIGVFAHEMGHGFWGLPDLYDRDYTSRGIGRWSLMAGGSWNGGTATGGDSPAWPDAWSRIQMGILTPTTISSNATGRSIPQAYNNPSPAETILKLDSATLGTDEYFLLENRQQVSGAYDQYLPGAGLFVWHVDEAMWSYSLQNDYECRTQPNYTCSDTQHFLVRLAQADGVLHLENKSNQGDSGDPFPGTTVNRSFTMLTDPESSSYYTSAASCIGVTNISNSLPTMTADLQVSCAASTTTITSDNPDPSVVGQAVVVNFTVTSASGTPTGNVTVSDAVNSCTASVATGTCNLTLMTPGARTLTATYAGDTNFNGSSDTELHQVNKADSTTTITSDNPDPSVVGQPVVVSFSVTSAGGTPTGDVTVSDGVDSCTASVATGTCSLTLTTTGARTLTATYAGDASFNGSSDTEPHQVKFGVFLPLVLRNYTAPAAPPTAPTGLSATPVSESQINLTWSDLSSDETDFHIERSPNGSSGWSEIGTSPANTPSYSSMSLSCGTPYYYRVRAHRAGDNQYSAFSNTANATTTACPGLANGNFESGQVAWSESSTHGWDLIMNSGFPAGVTPHGGSWAVWLGGDYSDVSTIAQSVTVPSGSPYLGYWHWIGSEDYCGYDYGYVRVNGTALETLNLCTNEDTSGWVHRVVNLSAYSGTSVNLQFQVVTDSSLNSNWFIDDVAFQASASPLATGMRLTPVPWDWVPRIAVGQEATWRSVPLDK